VKNGSVSNGEAKLACTEGPPKYGDDDDDGVESDSRPSPTPSDWPVKSGFGGERG